jgi:NAD-dependent SIR2 family protein deacetylase
VSFQLYPFEFTGLIVIQKPSPAHYFFLLLERHHLLRRVFTQNIDTLERLAGLPSERLVEAHGSFAASHCLRCHREADQDYVKREGLIGGNVVKCEVGECGGLVKPDIVFFGETLPQRFFQNLEVS